jgi:hypothetical protein
MFADAPDGARRYIIAMMFFDSRMSLRLRSDPDERGGAFR